jgi:hypothetical protein
VREGDTVRYVGRRLSRIGMDGGCYPEPKDHRRY